jgi:hypothetical protein
MPGPMPAEFGSDLLAGGTIGYLLLWMIGA